MPLLQIADRTISQDSPTYFIADIAANHDGDLERAKHLVKLAADAGADAAKFQNFSAEKIVSDEGFKSLGGHLSHQSKWDKSVFEVYRDASIPHSWTPVLKQTCEEAGIHYFSAPYDFESVDMLYDFVPAYKVGSGDVTWLEMLEYIAKKGKPVILATGASNILEVQKAVDTVLKHNPSLLLMQCNTNYTGSLENFKYINLRVINTYRAMYPGLVLGLSDHSPGHSAVLGAVALGARAVEKHFTDDTTRSGPDHPFSMNPVAWKEMVRRTRELEFALGSGIKDIEENEKETVVLQRRAIRAAEDIKEGTVLKKGMLKMLRPCPEGSMGPHEIEKVVGKKAARDIKKGFHISKADIQW